MIEESNLLIESRMQELFQSSASIEEMNEKLFALTGILDFFESGDDLEAFRASDMNEVFCSDREFGDFQTPVHLSNQVCRYLRDFLNLNPSIVIEPTFGKGNFIASATHYFPAVQTVYGVEIQKSYYWLTKKNILRQALTDPASKRPETRLFHDDIFTHDFDKSLPDSGQELLIVGNPPWITNAELGSLESSNLPKKQNFKEYKGLDALTGKSNFDICEHIILLMLETFKNGKGTLAMLCKNSVAKKIVHDLPKRNFKISDLKLLNIDAKKDFNAAADASLFVVKYGISTEKPVCRTYKLDEPDAEISSFGWFNHKFVSNIDKYANSSVIDDCSQFTWRSGIKHDCSSVMELDSLGATLTNKLKETVEVEDNLVFDLLKSSDLKSGVVTQPPRKKVIVTQKSIGADTSFIAKESPKLWQYLMDHKSLFDARKSSIYKGKPDFSIFGVGEYSFSKYKVAISGMYKNSAFTLVLPMNDKPVMLDDTCYFLSFADIQSAVFTFAVLNSSIAQDFLQSVVFLDEKRPYTKDILMRIDLYKAAERTSYAEVKNILEPYRSTLDTAQISEDHYQVFIEMLNSQALLL